MTLTNIDKHSLTWRTLEAWVKEARKKAVGDLIEGTPRDDLLRGRIQTLDDLLSLADEKPDRKIPTSHY